MIAVVVSRADSASVHVGEHLREIGDWESHADPDRPGADGGGTVYRTDGFELREFDALHLSLENVAAAFDDPDLLVFASRHSGETGPLLTAHHTGNFGPAEHGGADHDLARACPNAHSRVVDALAAHAPDGYEVGTECTHHGPSAVGVPSMFVEVGSGQEQWDDPDAARAVARAILALRGVAPDRQPETDADHDGGSGDRYRRHLVGFGGGHYAPRFGRIARETDWAVGHVGADWCLEEMGDPREHRDVIEAAFTESAAAYAVIDGDRPELATVVEDLGYRVVSETWVRAVDGVSLALVADAESALVPVDGGLRFGDRAREADGAVDFDVRSLPADLLAAVQGIDADATRAAVEGATVAFETREAGNRIEGAAAVASRGDYERLVADLLDVLRTEYDDVERDGSEIIARREAFDPGKARELGVPEGPKFGRLAGGRSVDVNGETIHPEQVQSEQVHRFTV